MSALTLCLTAGCVIPAAAGVQWHFVELGIDECANDINDFGVVVTDTKLYWMGKVKSIPKGLDTATAINNRGQIAGTAGAGGAVWDGRKVVTIAPLQGDTFAFASDLNDHGDVVGTSGSQGGPLHAFIWRGGITSQLAGLSSSSAATGMNDIGQVVGYSWVDDRQQAVRWEKDGAVVALAGLGDGSGDSLASNINNDAVATGYSYTGTGSGVLRAVTWSGRGVVSDIDVKGGEFGVGVDINDRGQVVGSTTPPGGRQSGYAWTKPGPPKLMPLDDDENGVLKAVNVLGWAVGCDIRTSDGFTTATMWRSTARR